MRHFAWTVTICFLVLLSDGIAVAEEGWGEVANGVKTRLTLLEQNPVIGSPIRFKLEFMNVSESVIRFDSHQVAINNSMKVIAPGGEMAPYVYGSHQTGGAPEPLSPGESVVLFDDLDVGAQYYIGKPGKYLVQFRGGDRGFGEIDFPPSNTVELEVGPGTPTLEMELAGRLFPIMKEGWKVDGVVGHGKYPGSGNIKITSARVLIPAALKSQIIGITLYLTSEPRESKNFPSYLSKELKEGDYLGEFSDRYVYLLHSAKAVESWPNAPKDISGALGIVRR